MNLHLPNTIKIEFSRNFILDLGIFQPVGYFLYASLRATRYIQDKSGFSGYGYGYRTHFILEGITLMLFLNYLALLTVSPETIVYLVEKDNLTSTYHIGWPNTTNSITLVYGCQS